MVLRDISFIEGYARLPRKKSPTKDESTIKNFKAHKKMHHHVKISLDKASRIYRSGK